MDNGNKYYHRFQRNRWFINDTNAIMYHVSDGFGFGVTSDGYFVPGCEWMASEVNGEWKLLSHFGDNTDVLLSVIIPRILNNDTIYNLENIITSLRERNKRERLRVESCS